MRSPTQDRRDGPGVLSVFSIMASMIAGWCWRVGRNPDKVVRQIESVVDHEKEADFVARNLAAPPITAQVKVRTFISSDNKGKLYAVFARPK